jgi:hypothetical protein
VWRERERERQTDRQTDRHGKNKTCRTMIGKRNGLQGFKGQRCRYKNYVKIELQTLLLNCIHTWAMDVVVADLK